ncbi:putative chalcone isomerase [Arabidopsis thaliana]
MKLDLSWSSSSPMPLPSVTPLHVDAFTFPPAVESPASHKRLFLGGAGKFVIVTVIGVYLEAMALPSISAKWKGKNAKELTESVPFFSQLVTGEFEKLARVTMKKRLTGIRYSEKVVEYCEEIMKASGKYTRSEAKAIDQFLMVFKNQDFPPGSSIIFAICPKGSLTIAFSKEERVPKTGKAVIKNKLLGEAVLESMIGKNGVSPATRKSLAERLSKLMNKKDPYNEANVNTPSSTRRVTRSQTRSAINNLLSSKKADDWSDKCQSKSVQRNGAKDRSALFDITNDSPIVGLAMQTPSSGVVGKRNMSRINNTPGSGEALLRGQVKNLLQKVEEEADLTKISLESRPFIHLVTSPMGLLAPTPANTPQVLGFSDEVQVVITSPVVAGQFRAPSQVVESNMFDEKEESLELEKSPSITRSLLLDFSDKSELWESSDCSSVVTQNPEDDNSSVWSMQANASAKDEEYDDEEEEAYSYGEEYDEEYYDEEEEEDEGGIVDGLCEGIRKMSVETDFAGNTLDLCMTVKMKRLWRPKINLQECCV